ncbi:MAG: ABC transporter permease [Thermoanaerobaculia bacterium]
MIDVLVQAIPLAIVASVPLLLAVEGEVVAQRSGIINLGIEGMMLTAAMTAVVAAQITRSVVAGFIGGVAGALAIAALFGVFAIVLRADQIVTGTAINFLALGVTGFIYREIVFVKDVPHAAANDVMVVVAWIAVPLLLALVLWRTLFGLRLRACGENPEAVASSGASVPMHRWAALMIEGVLVGLAGADLSLALSTGFAENMTAGRGFIALSIVIFGRWKFRGAIVGTALFGAAEALQFAMQAANSGVQFHVLLAVPYVVTLLILCGVAGRVRAPEALGRA